uniref:Uncharacterized protein n=1 Tax=Oncorhynchus kisutch TaxID=8019 RepID=A0A8C7N8V9_ONCKI
VPCVYKRKTSRSLTPLEVLDRAAKEVKEGKSIRAAAMEYFVLLSDTEEVKKEETNRHRHKVLSDDMESELAKNFKNFTDQHTFKIYNIPQPHSMTYEHHRPLSQDRSIHLPQGGSIYPGLCSIYPVVHEFTLFEKSNQISSYLYNRGVPQLTDSYSYEFYDQVCCYMHCACNTA